MHTGPTVVARDVPSIQVAIASGVLRTLTVLEDFRMEDCSGVTVHIKLLLIYGL